ncbi:diguanylate cyclase [uncultured Thiodictyon sp.]|uniref:diguanylate cyclase n=1 Tax=uncultured Thiodictyon sp. TaxID=1846217 RepID=UPI0025DC524B|nr:diguanylate cyclase [uncultured Thiodictyon sp.]
MMTVFRTGQAFGERCTTDPVNGCPLVVKQALDDGASLSALRNEQRILERLQGVTGCPRLVRFDPVARELAIEDFGGIRLSQAGCQGKLAPLLALSETLAHLLAAIHARGVIHRNIHPGAILIRSRGSDHDGPDELQVQLTDFDLATICTEENPPFEHPSRILGTPAFGSPEQTGRMNRPVDYRADLYSLGATLYALATGTPPFEGTDTLTLVHAHLAAVPVPPVALAPWLPPRLSDLILTLLAKEPDDRYQSAAGLAHDLRRLRRALAVPEPPGQWQLREHDLPLSPRPPRRLYGRDQELEMLLATFTDVTRDRPGDGPRGLFVAGYAGVGKTALINELHRPVTLAGGLFITGKCDQYQRDRPFLAPAQCLRQLCQWLLAEPEAAVAQWRERLLAGLGPDAGALFEFLPELEALLGSRAPAPVLGPLESQVRLRTLLVALLRQVAAPAHSLVLFLDDLQWADQPSLDFIRALLDENDLAGLLLIGAWRDNEIDNAHPVARLLRQSSATGPPAPAIALSNLRVQDLVGLLGDMLHQPAATLSPLATLVNDKTGGNPFFVVEFVNTLHQEGQLLPDPECGQWRWDAAAIALHPASANVVDFLAGRLARLSAATADILVAAACVGTACDLGTLALATGDTPAALAPRLAPALVLGILVTPSAVAFGRADPAAGLRFCHDRMAQAVHQLRDDGWRGRLHLAMARRFAQAGATSPHQFAAAEHYAAAAPLILDPAERAIARPLFIGAALRAREAGSFATAERFLRIAADQLPGDAWQNEQEGTFALFAELHLVLYSQSHHCEADEVFELLGVRAAVPLQLVGPTCIQIMSLTARVRYLDAFALGCRRLDSLGVGVPTDDLPHLLEQELDLFYWHIDHGALERLPTSPVLADAVLLGAARIMNRMLFTAFFKQPLPAIWILLRLSRWWLEHGYSDLFLMPLAMTCVPAIVFRGDYATGYRVACMALATGMAREGGGETARVRHVLALFSNHWFRPVEEDLRHARSTIDAALRAGDLELVGYSFCTTLRATIEVCDDLAQMGAACTAAIGFCRKHAHRLGEETSLPFRQLVRALEGKTERTGSFDDADFNEQTHQAAIQGNSAALVTFHIYRGLAACLFDDQAALARHVEAAQGLLPGIPGYYLIALGNLLHSLVLIETIHATPAAEHPPLLEKVAANQAWLAARAADAPMNFGHLWELVEAERLGVLERPWEAQSAFERAMCQAQAHQRPWHHALATERAGQFYLRRGLEHAGRPLLRRAQVLYRQWGAHGKVRAMSERLPFLGACEQVDATDVQGEAFNHLALLRGMQALASETRLAQLVARVTELVGQLTGATDVRFFMLDEAGCWYLEGGLRGSEPLERMPVSEAQERGLMSSAGQQLLLTSLQPVVSEDAVIDSRFAGDPHFAGLPLCSLLALPMFAQGRIRACLVLENRLFRAAFTAPGIETVSLLCDQLAISIENVRLYESLEQKVADRTRELETANRLLGALSVRDGLTGIANRRCFDETLLAEWRRAARSGQPLALAMFDVDWFKNYNDCYGHQAGDECLRTVAGVLGCQARRAGDLAARYGGEEFAFIAADTDLTTMLHLAEGVRSGLEACAIPHTESVIGHVTVSAGVAALIPENEPSPQQLLRLADEALYRAKAQGRNRTVLAAEGSMVHCIATNPARGDPC